MRPVSAQVWSLFLMSHGYRLTLTGSVLSFISGFNILVGLSLTKSCIEYDEKKEDDKTIIKKALMAGVAGGLLTSGIYFFVPSGVRSVWLL